VRAGQHFEANFDLASQSFHVISGTVGGYPRDARGIDLHATNAAGQQIPVPVQFDHEKGTFRTQWLPPGNYSLTAEMLDSIGEGYSASRGVNLTSDLGGVRLNLQAGTTIPISFQVERTHGERPELGSTSETRMGRSRIIHLAGSPPARLALVPEQPEREFSSRLAEGGDSTLEVASVTPGTYSVEIYPNPPYYVESARCGSVNLLDQNLTVTTGAGTQSIEITLRDDSAILEGSVKLEGGTDSALVILIPREGRRRIQTVPVSRPVPGPGGESAATFTLWQVAPGSYRVLAVDRAEDFEYGNPEILREYADKASEISFAANQRAKIELDVVHTGE